MQEKIIEALSDFVIRVSRETSYPNQAELSILPEISKIVLSYPLPASWDSPDKNK